MSTWLDYGYEFKPAALKKLPAAAPLHKVAFADPNKAPVVFKPTPIVHKIHKPLFPHDNEEIKLPVAPDTVEAAKKRGREVAEAATEQGITAEEAEEAAKEKSRAGEGRKGQKGRPKLSEEQKAAAAAARHEARRGHIAAAAAAPRHPAELESVAERNEIVEPPIAVSSKTAKRAVKAEKREARLVASAAKAHAKSMANAERKGGAASPGPEPVLDKTPESSEAGESLSSYEKLEAVNTELGREGGKRGIVKDLTAKTAKELKAMAVKLKIKDAVDEKTKAPLLAAIKRWLKV